MIRPPKPILYLGLALAVPLAAMPVTAETGTGPGTTEDCRPHCLDLEATTEACRPVCLDVEASSCRPLCAVDLTDVTCEPYCETYLDTA